MDIVKLFSNLKAKIKILFYSNILIKELEPSIELLLMLT